MCSLTMESVCFSERLLCTYTCTYDNPETDTGTAEINIVTSHPVNIDWWTEIETTGNGRRLHLCLTKYGAERCNCILTQWLYDRPALNDSWNRRLGGQSLGANASTKADDIYNSGSLLALNWTRRFA
jgi:hypothetical protein